MTVTERGGRRKTEERSVERSHTQRETWTSWLGQGDGHRMNQDEDLDWLMRMKEGMQNPFTTDNFFCFTTLTDLTLIPKH